MSFTTKDTPWCTLNLHDQEQGVRAFSRIIISTYQGILKFSRAKFSNIGFWDALSAPFIFHQLTSFYLNLLSVINTKLWLN